MTDERRRLEPLRLDPSKQVAPAQQGAATPPAVPTTPAQSQPRRSSLTIVLIAAIVVLSIGLVALAITPIQGLIAGQRGALSSPTASTPAANDGSDPTRPALPASDTGFVDARSGWGWGDRCYTNILARKWGWAKAECDKGLAMNPASPQPRASLLYNEGLIAKAAGAIDEARRDFISSLALRENGEVRAALNSLNPSGGGNDSRGAR